jgi:hypothetical protein
MAVFIGATKKSNKVFTLGKPYKVGKLWAQDLMERVDGKLKNRTDYATKKSIILNRYKDNTKL